MRCTLQKKGFISRWLQVETPEGKFDVVYQGLGMGYERVIVNGKVAAHKQSLIWFAPKFEFMIGSSPAVIEVRVWVWFKIKSFSLTVNNQTLYSETS